MRKLVYSKRFDYDPNASGSGEKEIKATKTRMNACEIVKML